MIEIRITKEIGGYKPKFLGPFTLRQVICLLIGVPICYFIFKFTAPYLPSDLPGFLCAIPAGIAWLFGWYEPYGMPTEKFLKSIAVNVLMAPTKRPYKIKNSHEEMLQEMVKAEETNAPDPENSSKVKRVVKQAREKISKHKQPEYYL